MFGLNARVNPHKRQRLYKTRENFESGEIFLSFEFLMTLECGDFFVSHIKLL